MSWHNLILARNHAEDMVAVSSLPISVYPVMRLSAFKCYISIWRCVNNLWSHFQQCPWR